MNLIALYEREEIEFELSYLIIDNKSMVESLKSIKNIAAPLIASKAQRFV